MLELLWLFWKAEKIGDITIPDALLVYADTAICPLFDNLKNSVMSKLIFIYFGNGRINDHDQVICNRNSVKFGANFEHIFNFTVF